MLCLTFLWGCGHYLFSSLTPEFKDHFSLNGWRGDVIANIFDLFYFFLPVPAAIYARQFGYKAAILLSLGCLMAGSFTLYPAAEMASFNTYAMAVSFLLAGWVVLENATNPLILEMGPEKTAVRRLNLMQCFYPLGAIIGIGAGYWIQSWHLTLPHAGDAMAIAHPYILVGGVGFILAFAVEEISFPVAASARCQSFKGISGEIKSLLANPGFQRALTAQACCIFMLGSITGFASEGATALGVTNVGHFGSNGLLISMLLYGAGRIGGCLLMFRYRPANLLAFAMVVATPLVIAASLCSGSTRAVLVLFLNLPLAICWPTVIGLTLAGQGSRMKIAGGLLSTAGAAGGIALGWTYESPVAVPDGLRLVLMALCSVVITRFALSCSTAKHLRQRRLRPQ
ncbi:FHS family L-fucose permease-like MFS transporter [Rhizomicrobium palustre]|uniref:FHS family L-fucose permease-like MFS transporter n=1 Tax=Rhizomicrobium palustre TaxID=189966 RepID=A0A846N0Z8_9PROT|nr:sugar MFS transporter [Rhizomicrobium palustre]NIK89386.1 FHS family L-fucose permease-like MFS transporter [Rhizomicrobium palustre]